MKRMTDRIYKPGRAPGKPAVLLAWLVLALTVPDTGLNAQVLDISRAALLSWPEPTQEQIVLGADSPASNAVWTPWPEPIFKRFGQMCMTVPTTASQQYFKLVPGRQFADDFSDTQMPYTNRGPWKLTPNTPDCEFLVTNGVLRLNWHGTNDGLFVAQPLGSEDDTNINNFFMSVDILDWVPSGTNWNFFALLGRGVFVGASGYAYGGGLALQRQGTPGKVEPFVSSGGYGTFGAPFDIGESPPPYRLEFSGVGYNFSLRVVNLTTKVVFRQVNVTYVGNTQGFMGLSVSAQAGLEKSRNITVDNFFATGTKP
jgi:hypothetical protein